LFPKERYSPAGLKVLRALPRNASSAFSIAGCFGYFRRTDGSRATVRTGADVVAVVLEMKHRQAAIEELSIKPTTFRDYVEAWKRARVAHSCVRGTLALFMREPSDECPNCHRKTGERHFYPSEDR
jgi:hypothetical protein